jgi:GTP-binding protein EngB required for normal cell division
MYNFGDFASPTFTNSDFDAKPMVLLLGQYSVGKTSFIRYLIGRDFPGARIGPEPTTDRFNAVMSASDDRIVPGNALAVDKDMPFSSLTRFGTEFLNKFQASMCPSPVLDKVYFVDSPGVLSGEKQKLGRAYDFVQVTEWFAQRADLILLLFDAHKLDISDEFQGVIKSLKGQDDKIRVVLNKADKVSSQSLMRVYGAMMWSLGKVVNTPEVMRVYIGSFCEGGARASGKKRAHKRARTCASAYAPARSELVRHEHRHARCDGARDAASTPFCCAPSIPLTLSPPPRPARPARRPAGDGPCQNLDMEKFFLAEQSDLLHDLHDLPRNAAIRKVNELVKRARMAKVHALVVGHLKSQMPSLFGHAAKQQELIGDMANQFFQVMKKYRLPQGDFPNLARFQDVAKTFDFNKWKKLDERLMVNADDALSGGIPALLKQLAEENDMRAAKERSAAAELMGSAFDAPAEGGGAAEGDPGSAAAGAGASAPSNPFGGIGMGGKDAYAQWAANVNKQESDSVFKMLPGGQEGLVSGAGARNVLLESGIDTAVLRSIWDLSDIDRDGYLDRDEFAVCWYLLAAAKKGTVIPATLPNKLMPPTKTGKPSPAAV